MATAAGHRRPPTGAAAVPFATYNLLAPWTEGDLTAGLRRCFDHATTSAVLSYDHASGLRRSNLASALDGYELAALVEVEPLVLRNLLKDLAERGSTMGHVFGLRDDEEMEWGSAIVWRKGAFKKVDHRVGSCASGWRQTYTAVLLQHVATGSLLCVVAVHLKAGGDREEKLRMRQAQASVEGANALLRAHLDPACATLVPTIVAGDFNSDGFELRAQVRQLMQSLGFEDAGREVFPTRTYKHHGDCLFDYIFTRGLATSAFGVRDDAQELIAPNPTEGSDHCPVCCTLHLLPPRASGVECAASSSSKQPEASKSEPEATANEGAQARAAAGRAAAARAAAAKADGKEAAAPLAEAKVTSMPPPLRGQPSQAAHACAGKLPRRSPRLLGGGGGGELEVAGQGVSEEDAMLAAEIATSERGLRDAAPSQDEDSKKEEDAMLAVAIALSRQESYASSSSSGRHAAPPMDTSDSSAASGLGHERSEGSGLASDPVVIIDDDDL